MTDTTAIRDVVERSFAELGRIDVVISNAGYGLFGAAEELTDPQVERIVATNLVGPIQLIRAALPHLRAQGGGRVIQISSYGGQVAFPGNSLYHATKWGIEGFVEVEPAPLRLVLGSQALESTLTTLRKRIAGFEAQAELAASTDFPPGE